MHCYLRNQESSLNIFSCVCLHVRACKFCMYVALWMGERGGKEGPGIQAKLLCVNKI